MKAKLTEEQKRELRVEARAEYEKATEKPRAEFDKAWAEYRKKLKEINKQ